MKKLIITHLLLNLYLLVLVLPSVPVLEYLINYNYIVSELCENRDKPVLTCNGKCYLADQVEKQLNLDLTEKGPIPPKIDLEKFISLKSGFKYELSVADENHVNRIDYNSSINEDLFLNFLLRPPQV
jgi:hypothetical protein